MSLGGILLCITGKLQEITYILNHLSVFCVFRNFLTCIVIFQALKLCSLILDTFHSCQSRYVLLTPHDLRC